MTLVEGSRETLRFLTVAFWNRLINHNQKWRDAVSSTLSQFAHICALPVTSHWSGSRRCSPAKPPETKLGKLKRKRIRRQTASIFSFRHWFLPLCLALLMSSETSHHFILHFNSSLKYTKQREHESLPLSCCGVFINKKFWVFLGCISQRRDSHNPSVFFSRKVPISGLVPSASCTVLCGWRNRSQQLLTLLCPLYVLWLSLGGHTEGVVQHVWCIISGTIAWSLSLELAVCRGRSWC